MAPEQVMAKPSQGFNPGVKNTLATPNINLNGLQRNAMRAPIQTGIVFKIAAAAREYQMKQIKSSSVPPECGTLQKHAPLFQHTAVAYRFLY
jgi:hypothetical protein